MKTNKHLFILIILCLCSFASAATTSWINGITGPSDWTIDPPNPDQTDTISFSGPIGLHGNTCFARADLGGNPMISVDSINRIVELWFQGPAPTQCTLEWNPVSGLQGNFGPLAPGNWTFICTVPTIAFELNFTVSGTTTGTIHYVDQDAPGPFHNGTSWKWAFTNIQDALDTATTADIIFVAEGTYKPDQGDSVTPGDRTASFELKNDISLIGSYAGYWNVNPNARDIDAYTTTLSGDLNNDDLLGISYRDDNSYNIVSVTDCPSCSAVLDGFVITGGQADGPSPYNAGGGVYIDGTNPTLINCTLSDNNAAFGGGIASINNSSPYILNCKIIDNSAQFFGGGLYCYSNNMNLINCLITGNTASLSEYIGGSAVYNLGSNITLINCTIADNPSPNGMGIASFAGQLPASNYLNVHNCILFNGGNEILTNHLNTISVLYTCLQGGWAGTGTGNISTDPMFVNSGDYQLQSSSPCIDAGNDALLPNDTGDPDNDGNTAEQLSVDIEGEPRVQGAQVNMGAYESIGSTTPPPPDPSWQHIYTIHVTHTKIQENPSASLSTIVTITLPIPIQGILKLDITPASPAEGIWNAWLDPDPGVVGPGNVTMTIRIQATNVDLTQFPSGPDQRIADLKIYVQPVP